MTTKEKIVRKSIQEVEKSLKEIDELLKATPLTEIIKIRQELQILLLQNITGAQRTSPEFMIKIDHLEAREKEQLDIAKKAGNSTNLICLKIKYESELRDLKNELYYIERSKN